MVVTFAYAKNNRWEKTQSRHRALFIPKEGKETLEVNLKKGKEWSYDQRLQGTGVGYARRRY
jgi:hypothetical protein